MDSFLEIDNQKDHYWMQKALKEALKASMKGEVPVGAVVVFENKIISRAHNLLISNCDPTAHAEVLALRKAAKKIKNYRLINCQLYVTLEPCSMCVGAIVHSRIDRVIFGSYEPKSGAVESALKLLNQPHFNCKIKVTSGILRHECGDLLRSFFRNRRMMKK